MSKMRVLMITPYLSPVYGGISKVVKEVIEGLARQNLSIDLLTTNADLSLSSDVLVDKWIDGQNYRIRYCSSTYKNDFIISFSLVSWLWQNINHYDLVHTHTIFSPLMSVVFSICRLKKIPYIITPHGMLEPWAINYKKNKKQIYYQLWEKSNLNHAIAIQGIASVETQNIKSLSLIPPNFCVQNGIHKEDFLSFPTVDIFYQKFPETKNKTIILFLGRIDPKKGLDLLATAFAKVRQKYPHTHLVIAGPDNIGFLPTAKNYFAELNCLDSVTFTGMLTGEMKYSALATANIYVAPSYSEGFSMSILEGMASGLPCIFTTGCNFPEAQEAKVAHVVDINSESIEKALLDCLQNPTAAKQMGLKAKEFILENYTWDEIAKKLIQVYEEILKPQNK